MATTNTFFLRKRDGRLEPWAFRKLKQSIKQAFTSIRGGNGYASTQIAKDVEKIIKQKTASGIPGSEDVLEAVEKLLIKKGYIDVANAYLLYYRNPEHLKRVRSFFGVKDDLGLGLNAMWLMQDRYLKRDEKGEVVETPCELMRRVSHAVSRVEKRFGGKKVDCDRWEKWFTYMLCNQAFLPNTPTLMNAGTDHSQLSACFVLPIEDSVSKIFDTLRLGAEIQKTSGGIGYDFSPIRPEGDVILSTGGRASGPVSFVRLFNDASSVMRQGGRRSGANMGVLRFDHPDIESFIQMKMTGADLPNFNLSVGVTDTFMRAVEKGGEIALRNPRTGKRVGKKNAKELFDLIVDQAWKTGDPGLIFLDAINRSNATRHLGKISATNPCGEQPLHAYESCNLGSINLMKVVKGVPTKGLVDYALLRQVVHGAVRFLDNVIEISQYPDKRIAKITRANRRIGLGVMGFAELLIHLGIPYGSKEAVKEAERLMRFVKTEAYIASEQLARERGVFKNFEGSAWEKKGRKMRNAAVTTIAPTGSTSVLAGCSSSIEPLFAVGFLRKTARGLYMMEVSPIFEQVAKERGFWNSELLYRIMKTGSVQGQVSVPKNIQRLFQTSHEIPVDQQIRIQAAFQKHVDSAVSKTINLSERATRKDVARAFLMAWRIKCKGITIYRDGSREDQILSIGRVKQVSKDQLLMAEPGYAGGCTTAVCLMQ